MLVERTVSRWQDGRWVSEGEKLSDFRSVRAYVLLGEPGAGKSTALEEEEQNDANAVDVTARRFIRRSFDAHPEWRDATLLIDGLDEVRAGGGDPREPLDALVRRFEELGNPRFRLSCREDSWLGQNDFRELSSVIDGEELHLLRLDPLSEKDAEQILSAAGVPDPDRFLWKARDGGLEAFLQNPLLLDILMKAQGSGAWPDGRLATFERACETLAGEANREHLDARGWWPVRKRGSGPGCRSPVHHPPVVRQLRLGAAWPRGRRIPGPERSGGRTTAPASRLGHQTVRGERRSR